MKKKHEVQAAALGVVVGWLRHENHYQEEGTDREARWVAEAQERLVLFIELEIAKLKHPIRRK